MVGLRSIWQWAGALLRRMPMVSIGGLNALMLVVNVGISLLLVRYLPKEAYGQLVYFYAGVGLTRLLMNFGLGPYITREIAALHNQPDALRQSVYSTLIVRIGSISMMWLSILILNATTDQPFLGYIALAGFFASVADMAFAMVSGLRMIAGVALITAAQPVLYAVLAAGFIVVGQSSAELLMLLSALSYVGMAAAAITILIRSRQIGAPRRTDFDWHTVRRVIVSTIPIYLVTLASQAYLSLNGGALGARGDFIASANYGAAFNLITMVLGLSGMTLGSTFYPQISHAASQGQRAALLALVHGAVTLLLRVYVFIAVLLAAFSETIVSALYGTRYADSAAYLVGLAPIAVLMGAAPVFSFVLLSQRRQWLAVMALGIQTALLLLTIAGAPALTPEVLVMGTLISVSVGSAVLAAAAGWTLRAVPFQSGDLAVMGLAVGGVLVLRQVQLSIGAALSVWHIVAGLIFMVVYWSIWLISGKLRWASSPS